MIEHKPEVADLMRRVKANLGIKDPVLWNLHFVDPQGEPFKVKYGASSRFYEGREHLLPADRCEGMGEFISSKLSEGSMLIGMEKVSA